MTILDGEIGKMFRPIPGDLQGRLRHTMEQVSFTEFVALSRHGRKSLNDNELLKIIARTVYEQSQLDTLASSFSPFTFNVGMTAKLILPPNKSRVGYRFHNYSYSGVVGNTKTVEQFPLISRPPGTYTAISDNAIVWDTSRWFLHITVAPTTLEIHTETIDDGSGGYARYGTNIFAGVVAPGTYYVSGGQAGTDVATRSVAVQTGTGTWSVNLLRKGLVSPLMGNPTIFLGNANVTLETGYPISGGDERKFWLTDNTPVYAIANNTFDDAILKVFKLQ